MQSADFLELKWKPDYEIGYAAYDAEHRELFGFANRVLVAIQEKDTHAFIQTCFTMFLRLAEHHFLNEEVNMAEAHYSEFSRHRDSHQRELKALTEYAADYAKHPSPPADVRNFLQHTLLDHILKADSQFVPAFNSRKAMLSKPRKLL